MKRIQKDIIEKSKPRNYVAKYAKQSGAGSHVDKKYNRREKHKNSLLE